jgi:hypothetical protein
MERLQDVVISFGPRLRHDIDHHLMALAGYGIEASSFRQQALRNEVEARQQILVSLQCEQRLEPTQLERLAQLGVEIIEDLEEHAVQHRLASFILNAARPGREIIRGGGSIRSTAGSLVDVATHHEQRIR